MLHILWRRLFFLYLEMIIIPHSPGFRFYKCYWQENPRDQDTWVETILLTKSPKKIVTVEYRHFKRWKLNHLLMISLNEIELKKKNVDFSQKGNYPLRFLGICWKIFSFCFSSASLVWKIPHISFLFFEVHKFSNTVFSASIPATQYSDQSQNSGVSTGTRRWTCLMLCSPSPPWSTPAWAGTATLSTRGVTSCPWPRPGASPAPLPSSP